MLEYRMKGKGTKQTKGDTGKQRETKGDKGRQDDAQEHGKGHPHEGRQGETKGDKTSRNPAKTTCVEGDKGRQRDRNTAKSPA